MKMFWLLSLGFNHIQNKAGRLLVIQIVAFVLSTLHKAQMKWALGTHMSISSLRFPSGQDRLSAHTNTGLERGHVSTPRRLMDGGVSEDETTPPHLSQLPNKAPQNLHKWSELRVHLMQHESVESEHKVMSGNCLLNLVSNIRWQGFSATQWPN